MLKIGLASGRYRLASGRYRLASGWRLASGGREPPEIRRGISVLEMTLALLVLTVAVTSLAQLLTTAAAHRRTSEQRRLAVQEVANLAERIALWSWDELTAPMLGELAPSQPLLAALPSARLQTTLAEEAGPGPSKRVRLEVHWTTSAGQTVEPVGLTVWKHSAAKAAEAAP